ncbi:MAG: DNA mismatch repair protein MutS [Ruminococcaceae bacterium]|nr:DNA mismatch repair protein MutS [Oscillospiraceae bacterium]
MAEYTPMMRQYFEIKNEYKDSILMYRLGDFYEMFFDDARIASKVLEITLTGRDCGQEERAPMCGVPFHSVDSYIAKLVENGYTVAICEQTEDPSAAKGIVKREVIRVITPGTIMDSAALDESKNNYLASVFMEGKGAGVSFVDITTGEISVNEFEGEDVEIQLLNEISRFSPAEIIMNLEAFEKDSFVGRIAERFGCPVRNYYNWSFERETAKKTVAEKFGEVQPELALKGFSISSLGALLMFLSETQKTELANLREIQVIETQEYMELDLYSIRNLELLETMRDKKAKGSLLAVLNKTKTSMGGRLLRKWITMPLANCARIQNRHRAVAELVKEPILREEIIDALKPVQDIERLIAKTTYKTANCRDLLAIAQSLETLPEIKRLLSGCSSGVLQNLSRQLDVLDDVKNVICDAINPEPPISLREGNLIRDGFSTEVDTRRELMQNGVNWIKNFAEEEKEKTGIKNIKVGYNRVFGYYLEVSKQNSGDVPEYFVRKQTLSNCERYITPQIKEVEEKIVEAESQIVNMEYEMFCKVRDLVAEQVGRVQNTAHAIATVDVLCSFAYVAEKNRYVMPDMSISDRIEIKDGRHPVIENLTPMFIPNDTELDGNDRQIAIITGPNMAGKSTYMRQTALIVLMAQMGSFVPAASAEIGVVDRIFTRVGASDDLSAGQSTFMVEMNEVAYILDNATRKSLVILDEIGRGTSTFDGLAIAWAVVEYMANKSKCGAKTLFATHYHELTELEDRIDGVKNYCIAVKKNGDDITFLRKIIRGGADGSYGVEVAALAGVKKEVTKRAKGILKELELRDGNGAAGVSAAKLPKKKVQESPEEQMLFGGFEENEIIAEIKGLALDNMSPMEALTKLYALKAKAENL